MSQAQHEILEVYYQEIKALYETRATKELSFRTPLENLLKALKPSPSYTIIQEATNKETKAQEAKQTKSSESRDKETNSTQNQSTNTEFTKAEFTHNAKPDFKDKALGESRAIFEVCNCGTNSRKDNLLIQPSKTKIKEMFNDMQKLERESILQKYHLKETQDWIINDQRKNFKNPKEQDIIQIAYKPFDTQFIFYPLNKISKIIPRGDSRKEIMKHFLQTCYAIKASIYLQNELAKIK